MSEGFTDEHKKLYQYAGTSNLVLPSDRAKGSRRGDRGKEIESLWGKIDARTMGAAVRPTTPPLPSKRTTSTTRQQPKTRVPHNHIDSSFELTYQPQTPETKGIWELLLTLTRPYLGSDQPLEVLLSAADEMLVILKNEDLKDTEKKKQVVELLGCGTTTPIGDAEFSKFIQLARQITDYAPSAAADGGGASEAGDAGGDDGVAVVFGGSDDEDEEDAVIGDDGEPATGYVAYDAGSSSDEEEEGDEEAGEDDAVGTEPKDVVMSSDEAMDDEAGGYRTVIHGYTEKNARQLNRRNEERTRRQPAKPAAAAETGKTEPLPPAAAPSADATTTDSKADDAASDGDLGPMRPSARSIDAFWLQRQVGKHYTDAVDVQQKTREALRLLSNRKLGSGELENELAEVFDYEHFGLVQTLVGSRELIVWCMQLARAEADSSEQAALVEEEMRGLGLAWIIAARRGEEEETMEQGGEGHVPEQGEEDHVPEKGGDDYVPDNEIDLAELAFEQGGQLMTNDRWVPPKGAVKAALDGYDEIRVPAPERLPAPGADEPAVAISSLPGWAQAAFAGTATLNRVQSRVFPTA
ncbi:Pre-mRNA splicing, partial [Coemansia sp. RSA 2424]